MHPPVEREIIFRGRKFDFERVTFESSGGRRVTREMVRHPGAVVILPILEEAGQRRIVMIKNRRFTLGAELWELPAGTMEAGEEASRCAARELEEETGYAAGGLAPLGSFYTTPGMTDELMRAFYATGLRHVGQRLEEDEQIRPVELGLAEVMSMMDRGEIKDAKTMLTLLLAQRAGLLGGEA